MPGAIAEVMNGEGPAPTADDDADGLEWWIDDVGEGPLEADLEPFLLFEKDDAPTAAASKGSHSFWSSSSLASDDRFGDVLVRSRDLGRCETGGQAAKLLATAADEVTTSSEQAGPGRTSELEEEEGSVGWGIGGIGWNTGEEDSVEFEVWMEDVVVRLARADEGDTKTADEDVRVGVYGGCASRRERTSSGFCGC